MPVDAYWAVACAGLAFCLALALVLAGHIRAQYAWALRGWERSAALHSETIAHLEATRIALREAQKNDHRDAVTGEYVKV